MHDGIMFIIITCLRTVVGVSRGMIPVKYAPAKPLFVSVEFHVDHKTVTPLS